MSKKKQSTQPVSDQDGDDKASRYISAPTTLELWVRSAGRCAHCNKFLLEEPFRERPINLGERAHIAGWTNTPGSPRGDSAVPLNERGRASNLILLCQVCHTIIDHEDTRADYPEERLHEMKTAHEDRISHVTAMGPDRETAVIRLIGSIRGTVPEMTRSLAVQSVVDGGGRYPKFPFAPDRHSIEIDLTKLPEPESDSAYWRLGRAQIDKAVARIADHIAAKEVRHLSIFAIARIPLLIYLGYALDDKVPIDLYQKHRGGSEDWIWPEDAPKPEFHIVAHRTGKPGTNVVVILSLSGTISISDLPSETEDQAVFEIRPTVETPSPNLFRSRAMLDAFTRTWQQLLSELEVTHKSVSELHLFPAAPITAAIACGRAVMRHIHPAVKVFERIGGREFQTALVFNEQDVLRKE